MKIRYLGILLIVITITACFKNLDPPVETEHFEPFVFAEEWYNDNPISFSHPEVGQMSSYVFYRARQYADDEVFDNFEYKKVIVSMIIAEEDENGFIIEEVLRPNSTETDAPGYEFGSTYQYRMNVNEELKEVRFEFPGAPNDYFPNILFGDTALTLSLETFTHQKTEIIGWKPVLSGFQETAFTTGYTLFNTTYDTLNIDIRNMFMDEDAWGKTIVYSANHGIVKTMTYGFDHGMGWDITGEK
ncbi:MAG: hypothetical protein DWQ02_07630 [Bacteroidetes bacterium]|nr:MAG: hypothetical protein DWQ02_07630 [Bacteroidota bacterium]